MFEPAGREILRVGPGPSLTSVTIVQPWPRTITFPGFVSITFAEDGAVSLKVAVGVSLDDAARAFLDAAARLAGVPPKFAGATDA